METTQKEELRKKFIELWEGRNYIDRERTWIDNIFDFFWKELEEPTKQADYFKNESLGLAFKIRDLNAKISRLESTLEAADDVINNMKVPINTIDLIRYSDAIEKYNQLKSNQQSPNS